MEKFYTGNVYRGASFTPLRSYDVFECEGHLLWQLTKGQFTKVDKHLFDYINQVTWGAAEATNKIGWYVYGGATNKLSAFKMHQYLAKTQRQKLGFEVDHKNNDPLDNRVCNLRLATRRQQQFNLPRYGAGMTTEGTYTSPYNGTRTNRCGNFEAHVQTLAKTGSKGLGTFKTALEAAIVRDEFLYEEFKNDFPLEGLDCNGIVGEPTLNFIRFNFPERLGL